MKKLKKKKIKMISSEWIIKIIFFYIYLDNYYNRLYYILFIILWNFNLIIKKSII